MKQSFNAHFSMLLCALGASPAGPPPLGAQVVINEIHYHPRSDVQEDEFIEIHNAGGAAADIGGWSFSEGVEFTFPEGLSILPGGYLVIARDADRLRARYPLDGAFVAGNYGGALQNGGEALELSDARGRRVERVAFSDEFPWPAEADGGGPSLERVDPRTQGATARNWLPSLNRGWIRTAVEGTAASNRLYLYLEGAGECLIDDLALSEPGSDLNLLPEGGFEDGAAGWSMTGTHAGSRVTTGEARSGRAALHLVATGPGSTAATSVWREVAAMTAGRRYVVSFWARPVSGNASLISRVQGGGIIARSELSRLEGTPGRENASRGDNLRPLIAALFTEPELPRPGERALLRAAVEDEDLARVGGIYDPGSGPREIDLRDDGVPPDAVARDGVFSGELPPAPRGAIVDFRAWALDAAGSRVETPVHRYPVATFDVASDLPVYHLFIRQSDWDRLNADIWTEEYVPAVFVHEGEVFPTAGLRYRGGRPRLFRKKSLKLDFPEEQLFEGRERLNLNAAAMDDDYLTEPLGYWFYERAGLEASRARFVRVERNGEFWGLFIDVEQVDERYLERHGLDPEGALYKSVGIVGSLRRLDGVAYEGQTYTYESQYEKKTREEEPYADLIELIHGLYATPPAGMEAHLAAAVEVEQYLNYLAASTLMCVWDHIQHNFYLLRDTRRSGRWRVLPWDLDHAWGEWEWQYYHDDTYHLFMGTESRPFAGVWYTWNKLWTVLFNVPRYRTLYLDRVRELLNTRFAEGPVFRKLDALRAEIEATVLLDEAKWPDALEPLHTGPRRTMAQEIPLLKQNFTRRRQHLARALGVPLVNLPARPRFLRGNLDHDGKVTLGDAIALLWFLYSGGNALDCADAADADDSGALGVSDAVLVLRFLFTRGPAPPAPGPAVCGEDPTADPLECDFTTCD